MNESKRCKFVCEECGAKFPTEKELGEHNSKYKTQENIIDNWLSDKAINSKGEPKF